MNTPEPRMGEAAGGLTADSYHAFQGAARRAREAATTHGHGSAEHAAAGRERDAARDAWLSSLEAAAGPERCGYCGEPVTPPKKFCGAACSQLSEIANGGGAVA